LPRCWGWTGWERRRTSSRSAAIRCWRPRWSRGCAPCSASRCRCGGCSKRRQWRRWRAGSRERKLSTGRRSRACRLFERRQCRRHRSRSNGSGFSISWSPGARPTTFRRRSRWRGASTWRSWTRRSLRWCGATRRCGRCSRRHRRPVSRSRSSLPEAPLCRSSISWRCRRAGGTVKPGALRRPRRGGRFF